MRSSRLTASNILTGDYEMLQDASHCDVLHVQSVASDSNLVFRVACLVTKHDATGNPTSCLGSSKPNL